MNRKSEEIKEKQISEVMASIENLVRHAYNQGYEQGLKASKQEPCEDAISRQAVLGIQAKYAEHIGATKFWQMCDDIKDLPPVNLEPKTGHWIKHEQNGIRHIECSECLAWFLEPYLLRKSYCPNCGTKMESEG